MDVKFGTTATFVGPAQRPIQITADGQVGAEEAPGVDRGVDGFLPAVTDARVGEYLRSGDVACLGTGWRVLPEESTQRHQRFSAQSDHAQQLKADFGSRSVTLTTGTPDGCHSITAHFERGQGRVVPQTILESFTPGNLA